MRSPISKVPRGLPTIFTHSQTTVLCDPVARGIKPMSSFLRNAYGRHIYANQPHAGFLCYGVLSGLHNGLQWSCD